MKHKPTHATKNALQQKTFPLGCLIPSRRGFSHLDHAFCSCLNILDRKYNSISSLIDCLRDFPTAIEWCNRAKVFCQFATRLDVRLSDLLWISSLAFSFGEMVRCNTTQLNERIHQIEKTHLSICLLDSLVSCQPALIWLIQRDIFILVGHPCKWLSASTNCRMSPTECLPRRLMKRKQLACVSTYHLICKFGAFDTKLW